MAGWTMYHTSIWLKQTRYTQDVSVLWNNPPASIPLAFSGDPMYDNVSEPPYCNHWKRKTLKLPSAMHSLLIQVSWNKPASNHWFHVNIQAGTINQPWLGMEKYVNIRPIKIVMTRGWCMTWSYPHYPEADGKITRPLLLPRDRKKPPINSPIMIPENDFLPVKKKQQKTFYKSICQT